MKEGTVHAMLGSPQFGSDPLPAQLAPPTLPFVMPLRFWAVPGGIRGQLLGLRITWPREHPRDHKWSLMGEVVRTNGERKILGEKTSRGSCTGCYCVCVVVINEVELLAARSDSQYSIKPPQAYSTTCPFQPCNKC